MSVARHGVSANEERVVVIRGRTDALARQQTRG
jgi:hypothetical protein